MAPACFSSLIYCIPLCFLVCMLQTDWPSFFALSYFGAFTYVVISDGNGLCSTLCHICNHSSVTSWDFPWWTNGYDSVIQMQGLQVRALIWGTKIHT